MGILTIVVLSRVRVSNPQQLTYAQILAEYPPGLTLINPSPNVTLHNKTLVGTFGGLKRKPDPVSVIAEARRSRRFPASILSSRPPLPSGRPSFP